MSLIERLILSRAEKHLAQYRSDAIRARSEFLHEYMSYLPTIKRCYSHAGYWHGTGRYHYGHSADSRYEGMGGGEVTDVLGSIVVQDGLTGHQDLWITPDGQSKETISVAPSRMHARMFAHIHLYQGVWLPYIFGGTRFWMGIIIALAAKELVFTWQGKGWMLLRQALFTRSSLQNFRTWGSALRKLDGLKVLPLLWRAYDFRSDIAGNYSILFGIKRSAVDNRGLAPFIKNLEVRVPGPVLLADMTHIEVPLENVEETRRMLDENNILLPVIPLEFSEIYCSQFSLQKLMYV
ncbi:MAG TPA: hypothetical protein VGP13_02240 [Candidatus Paceibacterota bacterium]|jgi:hypothetical protein|nr:hypothetical protein [Candidatus Paceibacterota bacterium]